MIDDISPPQQQTLAVDLTLGGTRLKLQLQVAAAPMRPTRALPLLRSVSDALAGDAVKRLDASGVAVSCRAGCAACCRYLVPIPHVEAWRLRELVEALPEPRRGLVRGRFADARERLSAAGILERLRRPEAMTPADHAALGDAYFALGLACPFLEEERCSIYRERPLTCREFFVVSPRELCGQANGPAVQLVTLPARASVAAAAIGDGPRFEAGGWVPLALALEWAEANPEPAARTSGPELIGRFFDALGESALPKPAPK